MDELRSAIRRNLVDGNLPCAKAEEIAQATGGASMKEIGRSADGDGIRISRCQLGLFGYRDFGTKGLARACSEIPSELAQAIRSRAAGETLPCAAAWQLAKEHGLPRVAIACACETLEVRITPCQLGCF